MSRVMSRSSALNQVPSGTPKPIFGRVRISAGRDRSMARLSKCLPVPFRNLKVDGIVATNSINT